LSTNGNPRPRHLSQRVRQAFREVRGRRSRADFRRYAAADEEFDYIVVGSGPGGGPLAVNLAKAGYKVALMEAGPMATKLQV